MLAASIHTETSEPAEALVGLLTVTMTVSRLVQPKLLVSEYTTGKLPVMNGVNCPVGVIPVPDQLPPAGVPVNVWAIGWLHKPMSFPAFGDGNGFTVMTTASELEQRVIGFT
jgi:hypothetical protein